MSVRERDSPPGSWSLLAIWAGIGLKSFGGGASTQLLIRRTFVEERGWIHDSELAHLWNLCLFTPGINLIALTVLIGRTLAGTRGILASLAGMLLPSAAVTCVLTAAFQSVHRYAFVHAALRGVVPATAGIMAVVAMGFARSSLVPAWKEGPRPFGVSVLLVVLTAVAIVVLKITVILVVIAVAIVATLYFTSSGKPSRPIELPDDGMSS